MNHHDPCPHVLELFLPSSSSSSSTSLNKPIARHHLLVTRISGKEFSIQSSYNESVKPFHLHWPGGSRKEGFREKVSPESTLDFRLREENGADVLDPGLSCPNGREEATSLQVSEGQAMKSPPK